jgi:hypothetical protein
LARDVLEIGAHNSIVLKDVEGFERYMAQLKTYYVDFSSVLPESAYTYELLGLNLLCLLSKNKIADFHTELEQLPADTLQNNPYIRCPVRLEQFLMEGGYNKVNKFELSKTSITVINEPSTTVVHMQICKVFNMPSLDKSINPHANCF